MSLRGPASLLVAVLLMASALLAQSARAEDAKPPGLSDVLTDLLGTLDEPTATEGQPLVGKRLPFGRKEIQLSFAPLVKETAPAVVNVYASQQAKAAASPFAGDPFFEQFFGAAPPRAQSSLGSGVIVDKGGLVVTNFHVIRDADEVKVALSDGREFTCNVLLKDESLDLAVLKIEGSGDFPVIPIGDSDALEIGDLVLAIGNPFGVGQTTTSGIVSALARSHIGVSDFGFFIQTDAAINPGNSGGGLINMSGELVGINTAIYSRSGGSIGIGFAIPSNMVNAVVKSALRGDDFFEKPYVGATFEAVSPQIAEALGLERPTGALVSAVQPDSPATRAGLKPGDVVLALNGRAIEHVDALGYRLATQEMGSVVKLDVLTGGEKKELQLTMEKPPEGNSAAAVTIRGRNPFAGAVVAELSPRLAQRLGMRSESNGVTVVEVDPQSPAARMGLQPRDIVRELNGEQITSAAQLADVADRAGRWWRFTVERDGRLLRQAIRF